MATPIDSPDPQHQPDPNQNSNPNPPIPHQLGQTHEPQDKFDDQEDPIEEEAAAANVVDCPDLPVPSSPSNTDLHVITLSGSCRGGGPKGKKAATKRRAQEKKFQKKLELLTEVLRPIPFVPEKTLDFSSHETLLKRLGLWDFVHVEFDGTVRGDLVAQLIATYNPPSRCSYVNGCRINVSRADLARALNLTVKKEKEKESIVEIEESKESIGFVEEFVSNWVLLHDDTWIMPVEVFNWSKLIKEGNFDKVDWAGLIWFMVEKELTAAPKLENCYYASHMQCLIKYQKEELLQEKPKMDVYDAKEEEEHNISGDFKTPAEGIDEFHGGSRFEEQNNLGDFKTPAEGIDEFRGGSRLEEQNNSGDFKIPAEGIDEFCGGSRLEEQNNEFDEGSRLVEHNIELSLGGQDNLTNKDEVEKEAVGDDDAMDCEENKGDEHQHVEWHLDGDSYIDVGGENFLRRCNLGVVGVTDMEEEKKQEKGKEGEGAEREAVGEMGEEEEGEEEEEEEEEQDEEEHHEEGFHVSAKDDNLHGLHSANLLEAMETTDLPGLNIGDNSSEEFPFSRVDAPMVAGVSSFPSNSNKRAGPENDISHHSFNGNSKRLRTDAQWIDKSLDFDMCMEQIQHLMGKARMMYAAKEQAYADSSMHQQTLLHELHKRDGVIEHLQKAKYEEQRKRQVEVYRLERELYLMENLLDGYRKALKETNRGFADYRARCPLADEPLYKDVSGSGGLVLSTMELEKQRLKQEEEERLSRLFIENRIKEFEAGWIVKFDAHKDAVSLWSNRLIHVENEVKLLKELHAKRKVSDIPECVPNDM
ncbi:hypothetical protein PTKIN_Ptkin01aG0290100 [Pterospermum kingtungense]